MVRTWPRFWLWVRINPGEMFWVSLFHWFCSFFSSFDSLFRSFPLATADSNIDPIFALRCPRVTSGRSGQLYCRSRNLQPTGARNALRRLSLQGWDMKHCIRVLHLEWVGNWKATFPARRFYSHSQFLLSCTQETTSFFILNCEFVQFTLLDMSTCKLQLYFVNIAEISSHFAKNYYRNTATVDCAVQVVSLVQQNIFVEGGDWNHLCHLRGVVNSGS